MVERNKRQAIPKIPAAKRERKLWGFGNVGIISRSKAELGWRMARCFSLPRGANRDEAFAVGQSSMKQKVDLVKIERLSQIRPARCAHHRCCPNTYAEWQIYVFRPTQRLSGFGGNMTVLRGTNLWFCATPGRSFTEFYGNLFRESGRKPSLALGCWFVLLVRHRRRSHSPGVGAGVIVVLGVFCHHGCFWLECCCQRFQELKPKPSSINAISSLKQIAPGSEDCFANE